MSQHTSDAFDLFIFNLVVDIAKFKESEYLFLVAIIEKLQRTKTLLLRVEPAMPAENQTT